MNSLLICIFNLAVQELNESKVKKYFAGVRMCVERPLKEPQTVDLVVAVADKGAIGKAFKKDAKTVQEALSTLSSEEAEKMDKALSETGLVILYIFSDIVVYLTCILHH